MPLGEVTYAPSAPETMLRELASVLPHLVSEAMQCAEEPYDGALRPGDVDIHFRQFGPFDRGGLPMCLWGSSRRNGVRSSGVTMTGPNAEAVS